MPDGQIAGQGFHQGLFSELVADIAEFPRRTEADVLVVRDYTARFLPAVLQGVEPKGNEAGRLCQANNAENSAFFFSFQIGERVGYKTGDAVQILGGGGIFGHGLCA